MAIELANAVSELDEFSPSHSDKLSQADDQIRLIKSVLKKTFPKATSPLVISNDDLNALTGAFNESLKSLFDLIAPHLCQAGEIKIFSGSISSIPAGYQLCNGTNGTEDLRDRFIVCAGGSYSVNNTGGATSKNTTTEGGHTHGGKTGAYTLTTKNLPPHSHAVKNGAGGSATGSVFGDNGKSPNFSGQDRATTWVHDTRLVQNTGEGKSFSMSISKDGGHNHSVNVLPPYFAKAYIQKVSAQPTYEID